jgi:acetyl-CoA synthetase
VALTAVAHLAIYRMGAVAVPLFQLFGADAIEYRLRDCGAKAVITDAVGVAKLPEGLIVLVAGGALDALMAQASDRHECLDTLAEDPALIIYTSGTTGAAKGALHAHRVLLGHLPGVEMPQDLFPSRATCSGRPRTGPGSAGCSTCCCPRCFTACLCWRTAW